MNLALRGARYPERPILHEFGHALGLAHEHQNPAITSTIRWDETAVIQYAYLKYGWTEKKTKRNILTPLSRNDTNFTVFDPESIMLYTIPNEWTIGDFETNYNVKLSSTDKSFIGKLYSRKPVQPFIQPHLQVFLPPYTPEVGDLVEIIVSAQLGDSPAPGANLSITQVGLKNVTISNRGTTNFRGLVEVRGTITDDHGFSDIRADWPDKGLAVTAELGQTAMQPHLKVFLPPYTLAVNDFVEIIVSAQLGDSPAPGANLFITQVGLKNVTISNRGTTDVSGLVRVTGTIADVTYGYVGAYWKDMGLDVRTDLPIR